MATKDEREQIEQLSTDVAKLADVQTELVGVVRQLADTVQTVLGQVGDVSERVGQLDELASFASDTREMVESLAEHPAVAQLAQLGEMMGGMLGLPAQPTQHPAIVPGIVVSGTGVLPPPPQV